MPTAQIKLASIIGPLFLVASDKGLQGVFWQQQDVKLISLTSKHPAAKILAAATQEIKNYFSGKSAEFKVPLDLKGTDFQKKVWRQLLKIPFGETRSYKDIAVAVKSEKAWRAVGTANGQNPISIIIPCHRVIASNGRLGGYAGGLDKKIKLLKLENINLQA